MNIKKLQERKNELIEKMSNMLDEVEQRAEPQLTEEEGKEYNELGKQLRAVSDTLTKAQDLRSEQIDNGAGNGEPEPEKKKPPVVDEEEEVIDETTKEEERAAFVDYIRATVNGEERGAEKSQLTYTDNGALVPKTIAKKIIDELVNICPIYEKATKLHFKGEVSFPVVDTATDDIVVGYAEEFADLTSHVNSFKSVTLKGYLFGALALISKSLINNSDIDVISIITSRIAFKVKQFIENQCLNGDGSKMQGVLQSENVYETKSADAVTLDDFIYLQGKIIDAYQAKCCYIMHPETRNMIRTLKDTTGAYLLNNDVTTGFTDMILGKPVYVSDAMPKFEQGKAFVFYGDPSGLYINIRENMSIEVLREKYHEQHAIGIDLWAEMDSKIVEKQKLAVMKAKASEAA